MHILNGIDITVVVVYFLILVVLGLYLKKKASEDIDNYFLGGRSLPWWALAISGMASFVDVAGTMIIVSFLYMLGPRGLFIEFRGGAVLVLPVMMLWAGKWHRRSGCMTGAEWMIFRFGNDFGGNFARIAASVSRILVSIGLIAYMVKGVGIFLSMFVPLSPQVCAIIMLGIATLYTVTSGFYGVVITDLVQSLLIIICTITVTVLAVYSIHGTEDLLATVISVTGNHDWLSSKLSYNTSMPAGYEAYSHLAVFAGLYLLRNVLASFGMGDDPKFFGAKSDKECSKLGFLWTFMVMFRWPMMMGFAVLGIFLVSSLFPDMSVVNAVFNAIKEYYPNAVRTNWDAIIAAIVNNPDSVNPDLIENIANYLGADWQNKLSLVGYGGVINPERIVPAVIANSIPIGFRGAFLMALIAASMSTFDSMINTATGFFTKDLYQAYLRPKASSKELIYISRFFCLFIVVAGFMFAYTIENINDIWGWIIMGIGGGMLVPIMLKFYWWRFNGGGFAVGTICGMVAAIIQRALFPGLDERLQFVFLVFIGFIGVLIGTYCCKPADEDVVMNFYKTTRPFGFWGKFAKSLPKEEQLDIKRENMRSIIALPFALVWQITMFLLPMQLVIGQYRSALYTFILFCIGLVGVFYFGIMPQKR